MAWIISVRKYALHKSVHIGFTISCNVMTWQSDPLAWGLVFEQSSHSSYDSFDQLAIMKHQSTCLLSRLFGRAALV